MSTCSEKVQFPDGQQKATPPKMQFPPEQVLFLVSG